VEDNDQNYKSFLLGLAKMSECFCDAMSEARQDLYWEVLAPDITMDEWDYACHAAMARETFHKVPLPAILFGFVHEYRKEVRRRQHALEEAARREQEQIRALQAGPPLSTEEAKTLIDGLMAELKEVMEFPAPRREERAPEYRRPLEDWEFAERRERLKAQAQRLMDENPHKED
jgi:hypothetical protein